MPTALVLTFALRTHTYECSHQDDELSTELEILAERLQGSRPRHSFVATEPFLTHLGPTGNSQTAHDHRSAATGEAVCEVHDHTGAPTDLHRVRRPTRGFPHSSRFVGTPVMFRRSLTAAGPARLEFPQNRKIFPVQTRPVLACYSAGSEDWILRETFAMSRVADSRRTKPARPA